MGGSCSVLKCLCLWLKYSLTACPVCFSAGGMVAGLLCLDVDGLCFCALMGLALF